MIDFRKMDDKDVVFVNKPLSDKEEKEFSDFLRLRKTNKGNKKEEKTSRPITQVSLHGLF